MRREDPADSTIGEQQGQAVRRSRGRLGDLRSVAFGLVAAALIASLGAVLAIATPASYTARASFLVLPIDSPTQQVTASLYEALDQGQIVNTIAQLVQSNIAAGSHPDVQVVAVTNTSIVGVTATASSPDRAAQQANAVAEIGQQIVAQLKIPYSVAMTVPASSDLATSDRMAESTIALLIALVAGLVGVGVQQAVWRLSSQHTTPRPSTQRAPGRSGGVAEDPLVVEHADDQSRMENPDDLPVSPHDELVATNGHGRSAERDHEHPAPSFS